MAVPCALCRIRETPRPYRVAGLDACETCWSGRLDDACAAWGLALRATLDNPWSAPDADGDRRVRLEITVRTATPHRFEAVFTQEAPPSIWARWLGRGAPTDPQVGDPTFDDRVRIDSDRDDVLALLADDGLQAAILAVVSDAPDARCAIERDRVVLVVSEPDAAAKAEWLAHAVAIAVRVEQVARRVGAMDGGPAPH